MFERHLDNQAATEAFGGELSMACEAGLLVFLHGRRWEYLGSGMGAWYLVEMVGFVALPCVLLTLAVRKRNLAVVRVVALMTLIGIVLNRLNVSIIAYKWYAAVRYVPTWMEVVVTLAVIFAEIWVFRWVVNRMPVLREHPSRVHRKQEPVVQQEFRSRVLEEV